MYSDLSLPPWQPLLYFGSLVILLAIALKLRRRLGMPVLLPLGLGLAAVGSLPQLAIDLLGVERLWQAIGRYFEKQSTPVTFPYSGVEVTTSFYTMLTGFRCLISGGLLLAALAIFLHSRRLAARARFDVFHPTPPREP